MEKQRELLLKSFDTELTNDEKAWLEIALKNDSELREEKRKLESMRKLFADFDPLFSDEFARNTVAVIEQEAREDDSLYYLFKRFAFGGAAAIALLLLSVYFTEGSMSVDALLGLSGLDSDSLLFALSNF